MHLSGVLALVGGISLASAAPSYRRTIPEPVTASPPFPTEVKPDGVDLTFPLSNGFPNTTDVLNIQNAAQGTLSNGPKPPSLTQDTLTTLRLLAFNEISEVAFFTQLLQNVTDSVPGYDNLQGFDRDYLIATLTAIQAQEQLHAFNVNGALAAFDKNGTGPIEPCEYKFDVETLGDAIVLANTFTDLVLGTLGDVVTKLATDQDVGLIRGVASVLGNEAEQDGFFRLFQSKVPSAQPFLTAAARSFAFTALQGFVVPGSCPQDVNSFGLTIFKPLTVVSTPVPGDGTLTFQIPNPGVDASTLQLVYISGQNLPIIEPLTNVVTLDDGSVQFEALFPQASRLLTGLTLAAVTPVANLTSVSDVEAQALFGPGPIEVN